ncbi:unnamed protein product [Camellia sinensis]
MKCKEIWVLALQYLLQKAEKAMPKLRLSSVTGSMNHTKVTSHFNGSNIRLHPCQRPGGAQTNSTTRSNPAGDARLPAVGGLGSLGLPEMFGSMQDTASLSQFAQNPAVSQMMQVLLSNPQYMNQILGLNPQQSNMLGSNSQQKTNYLIVDSKTTVKQIEEAFKEFTTREDVVIVMISQYVVNMIKFLMLVDDIGDVTITNDGAIILQMLDVEHPAVKVE